MKLNRGLSKEEAIRLLHRLKEKKGDCSFLYDCRDCPLGLPKDSSFFEEKVWEGCFRNKRIDQRIVLKKSKKGLLKFSKGDIMEVLI